MEILQILICHKCNERKIEINVLVEAWVDLNSVVDPEPVSLDKSVLVLIDSNVDFAFFLDLEDLCWHLQKGEARVRNGNHLHLAAYVVQSLLHMIKATTEELRYIRTRTHIRLTYDLLPMIVIG